MRLEIRPRIPENAGTLTKSLTTGYTEGTWAIGWVVLASNRLNERLHLFLFFLRGITENEPMLVFVTVLHAGLKAQRYPAAGKKQP